MEYSAKAGDSVDLMCRLPSYPSYQSSTTWQRESGEVPQKARQLYGGVIRIPDVRSEDGGRYICSNGRTRQYIMLNVDSYQGRSNTVKSGCYVKSRFYLLRV